MGTTMKRMFAVAVMMGMLAGPAYSQHKTPLQLMYEKQDRDRKDNERRYDETMKHLKSQTPAPAERDPWADVRPAPQPKR
jgi:hypothetical protein